MMCACEMGGGMWWMMALPGLLLAALVVAGIVIGKAAWNGVASRAASPEETTAISVLEERYARGEIDGDEFRQRRQHLASRET